MGWFGHNLYLDRSVEVYYGNWVSVSYSCTCIGVSFTFKTYEHIVDSIGGVYPLSSASAFEGNSVNNPTDFDKDLKEENTLDSRRRAGWAVSWQSPGQVLPYCVGLLLMSIYKHSEEDLQFRVRVNTHRMKTPRIILTF